MGAQVRSLDPSELALAEALVTTVLGSRRQVRKEESVDVLAGAVVGAWVDGELAGVAGWGRVGEVAELRALAVAPGRRGHGLGAELVEAVVEAARSEGCRTVWLVTTNDNLTALRLYQRHGFRLVELRPGAVDEARRTLKPEIPLVGEDGVPIRDELVLQRTLR
jgi:ribosomal protein S18 acetylase RimI-like enzyme